MSNIVHKVKEALTGDSTHTTGTTHNSGVTGTTGTAEGVAGPHSSRIANAADPRVDSDMDGSHRVEGVTTGRYNITGADPNAAANTTTPHNSTLLNKLDPRVDSTTGTTGGAGPHSSSLLNKLDPRVDSTTGAIKTTETTGTNSHSATEYNNTGTTGGLSGSTNAGPHDSSLANKLDPRVDSDLDGRGNRHGAATGGLMGASGSHATPGSGTAQNTAGPHNSDFMNKVDPRVDSDMDGSGTIGGNRTRADVGSMDPLDAAQVPPSVLRKHLGEPQITHDHPHHNHQGRHGSLSHQETHRGL